MFDIFVREWDLKTFDYLCDSLESSMNGAVSAVLNWWHKTTASYCQFLNLFR